MVTTLRRPTEDEGAAPDVTVDAFFGGRVEAVQPASGHHRAGLEAVLLAASLDSRIEGTVVDLGAGVGVAGFCAAARCRHAKVVLVERNSVAVVCAEAALSRPANAAFADRVRVISLDISAPESERAGAGIGRGLADHVLINPPFHAASSGTRSPGRARADAHILDKGGLDAWFRAAASVLKFGGDMTVIFKADGLEALLAAAGRRFGALSILPIHPREELPATRILVRAVKGSRAPLRLLPPLILHEEEGNAFTGPVESLLREGKSLSSIHRAWRTARGDPS
jgi:tRNA1(Val) A37 N6-methylase TrmN6